MKKDLKDYIHRYLGCSCFVKGIRNEFKISAVEDSGRALCTNKDLKKSYRWEAAKKITLILKPLEYLEFLSEDKFKRVQALFEDQAYEVLRWLVEHKKFPRVPHYTIMQTEEVVNLFREWGFDCDGLIDAGLAVVNKTIMGADSI